MALVDVTVFLAEGAFFGCVLWCRLKGLFVAKASVERFGGGIVFSTGCKVQHLIVDVRVGGTFLGLEVVDDGFH